MPTIATDEGSWVPFLACRAILRRCARSDAGWTIEFRKVTGERTYRGKLKQVDEGNLASQDLLQLSLHFGDGEGVSSRSKKLSFRPTAGTPSASCQAVATMRSISFEVGGGFVLGLASASASRRDERLDGEGSAALCDPFFRSQSVAIRAGRQSSKEHVIGQLRFQHLRSVLV